MMSTARALAVAIESRLPVALRGRPGVGKTSMVEALAEAAGFHVEIVVGSLREPTDLAGLPIVRSDGMIDLAAPRWALEANAATNGSLVLFDELTTASPAVQAAMLRIVREGVVGDLRLASHVRIVAAYNDATDCGGYDLELPMRSRFVHLSVEADVERFCDGLMNGWVTPASQPSITPPLESTDWRALVAAFVRARPSLLEAPPELGSTGGYPTPRTWELAADAAAAVDQHNEDGEVRSLLISGCVGPGAASEFLTFVSQLDLPDPRELLRRPEMVKDHLDRRRPDRVMLVLHSVAELAARTKDDQLWAASWEIAERAIDAGFADLVAWTFRPVAINRPPDAAVPPSFRAIREFLELAV
jgi:hypothetical protein